MDAGLIFQSEWLLTAVHSTKKDFYDRVHMATVIKVSLFKVWTDFCSKSVWCAILREKTASYSLLWKSENSSLTHQIISVSPRLVKKIVAKAYHFLGPFHTGVQTTSLWDVLFLTDLTEKESR